MQSTRIYTVYVVCMHGDPHIHMWVNAISDLTDNYE